MLARRVANGASRYQKRSVPHWRRTSGPDVHPLQHGRFSFTLNHRIDHNMNQNGAGFRVKYDTVRVAQGLAHMARDLRGYAARVDCPVLVVRSTIDSELSPEQAVEIAGLWRNGRAVDVEGGYLLYIQHPSGTAEAISAFVDSVSGVRRATASSRSGR